ncbi:MAG: bacillithiol biosynthesis deacetylase BshB1 [Ginsengibacter sp.]
MKLDILAFGIHPDDVELGCAGTLIVEIHQNKKVGIIDLSQGELGTRGNKDIRKEEADAAAKIISVSVRENLKMADGFFKNDQEHQLGVITALRKYRPEVIFCNAPEDRHPDHGRSSQLVTDAAFLSGLAKISTKDQNEEQLPWRPSYVFHYIQDRYLKPDFVVDISSSFDKKIESVKAYKTQFYNPELNETETYISSPDFLDSVVYRAKMFGKMIGVKYGEGFISKKTIGLSGLEAIIKKNT